MPHDLCGGNPERVLARPECPYLIAADHTVNGAGCHTPPLGQSTDREGLGNIKAARIHPIRPPSRRCGGRSSVRDLQQNIGVARLSGLAKAGEVFAAKLIKAC